MASILSAGAAVYGAVSAFGAGISTTAVGATMAATGLSAGAAQLAVAGASGAALGAFGMNEYKNRQFDRERADYQKLIQDQKNDLDKRMNDWETSITAQKSCTEKEREQARRLWNGVQKAKKTGNQGVIDYAMSEWEDFVRDHPMIDAKTGRLL